MNKKINYEDPTTKIEVKGSIAKALALRKVWNGLEGDGKDIEDIFDRVDGRVNGNGKEGQTSVIISINNRTGLYSPTEAEAISPERS